MPAISDTIGANVRWRFIDTFVAVFLAGKGTGAHPKSPETVVASLPQSSRAPELRDQVVGAARFPHATVNSGFAGEA